MPWYPCLSSVPMRFPPPARLGFSACSGKLRTSRLCAIQSCNLDSIASGKEGSRIVAPQLPYQSYTLLEDNDGSRGRRRELSYARAHHSAQTLLLAGGSKRLHT